MTTSRHQQELIRNLQTECHYLSLALNRLNEKTSDPEEYNFLKSKLVKAEEQLHVAMSAADDDNAAGEAAVVDDYSYNDSGPTNDNTAAAYYDATNSYRQQLQNGARSYGERKGANRIYKINDNDDGSSSSSSSSSDDSDDSSVGSAHRHVNRNYRKTMLVEKSRELVHSYKRKGKDYYHKSKEIKQSLLFWAKINDVVNQTSWLTIILLAIAFLIVVLSIALRYRPAGGKVIFRDSTFTATSTSSEPCALLSLSLKTDRFGNETSWDITQKILIASSSTTSRPLQYTESTIKSGGPYRYSKYTTLTGYTEHINESICLPVGEYNFILQDKMGDGICCEYGHGEYGLSILRGREIRPLSNGMFLGKEEISSFEITMNDVGGVLGSASSESSTGEDGDGSSSSGSNGDYDASTTTNSEEQTDNDQSSPGVSTEGWSEKTDDSDLGLGLDDGLDGGMGDDSLLSGEEDDLISTLEIQSDDAIDPLLYYNIENMDSNSDGKISKEEYANGSEEISAHCSVINVQTTFGRSECEKVCGEDHYCCFKPTQGEYDCKEDPSYACETFKPCEILFNSHPTDGLATGIDASMGESSGSSPTAQEMALIEESVYQYCSSGTAGLGMGKCQEICHDHLCCFETNFGVGNDCKSSYQGLCPYYAGCEQMAHSSSSWNSVHTIPNLDMNDSSAGMATGNGNQDGDFLEPIAQLTLEEKLQIQDQIDQACSEYNMNSGNGQCENLCSPHMCCFDASQRGCKDYDPMCPFVSSCEKMFFLPVETQPMNTNFDPMVEEGFGNRKRLRG